MSRLGMHQSGLPAAARAGASKPSSASENNAVIPSVNPNVLPRCRPMMKQWRSSAASLPKRRREVEFGFTSCRCRPFLKAGQTRFGVAEAIEFHAHAVHEREIQAA